MGFEGFEGVYRLTRRKVILDKGDIVNIKGFVSKVLVTLGG